MNSTPEYRFLYTVQGLLAESQESRVKCCSVEGQLVPTSLDALQPWFHLHSTKKVPKRLCHGYKDYCTTTFAVSWIYIGEDIESSQDEDLHGVKLSANLKNNTLRRVLNIEVSVAYTIVRV